MVIVFDAKVQREQRSQRAATAKPGGGGQWRRVFVGILSDSQALNIAQNARRPKGIMKRRRAKASFCVTECNERSSHRGVEGPDQAAGEEECKGEEKFLANYPVERIQQFLRWMIEEHKCVKGNCRDWPEEK